MKLLPAHAARPNPFTMHYAAQQAEGTDTIESSMAAVDDEPTMTRDDIRQTLRDAAAQEQAARLANLPAVLEERAAEELARRPDATTIKAAAKEFARECAAMVAENYKQFTSLHNLGYSRTVTIEFGRKYAKLIASDVRPGEEPSGHSAYCFVDLTNGDILKAATWRAPAKHSRGNVLRSDRMNSVTAYGANCMR